jgi:hypothetical protein
MCKTCDAKYGLKRMTKANFTYIIGFNNIKDDRRKYKKNEDMLQEKRAQEEAEQKGRG